MKHDSAKNRERILKAYQRNPNASIDELARAADVSHVTVHKHLKQLKQDGAIVRKFVPRSRGKSVGNQKKTAEQRRIDRVVRKAKRKEQQGGRDVVVDYGIRSFSFRATKVA